MFFCGNHPDCIAFNSEKALNIAKRNTEEQYSVVGILEDIEGSLSVLESTVPKFFSGSQSLYRFQKNFGKTMNTNKNPNKKKVSEKVKKELEVKFDKEIEFYEFCKQRLEKQKGQLEKRQKLEEFEYKVLEQYVEEFESDDYVLL